MKNVWIAIGSLATLGLLVLGIYQIIYDRNPDLQPKLNIRCSTYSVEGIQVRSNSTGNWNIGIANEYGDITLDMEYQSCITEVALYSRDRKKILKTVFLDFTGEKTYQQITVNYDPNSVVLIQN